MEHIEKCPQDQRAEGSAAYLIQSYQVPEKMLGRASSCTVTSGKPLAQSQLSLENPVITRHPLVSRLHVGLESTEVHSRQRPVELSEHDRANVLRGVLPWGHINKIGPLFIRLGAWKP